MKHKFIGNGTIELIPENEIECYALRFFIEDFKRGLSTILIHRDEVGNNKTKIKLDTLDNTKILIKEISV